MKTQNNNEQIVFDMFEEVATESIAEARNAFKLHSLLAKATKEVLKTFIG